MKKLNLKKAGLSILVATIILACKQATKLTDALLGDPSQSSAVLNEPVNISDGLLVKNDSGPSVFIPPNAVDRDANLIIFTVNENNALQSLPENYELLSPLYEFDIGETNIIGEVEISIPVEIKDYQEKYSEVFLATYAEGEWQALPSFVDEEDDLIYARATHFSVIAAIGNLFERTKIDDIRITPRPYIFQTVTNVDQIYELSEKFVIEVLLDDPKQKANSVTVFANIYTFSGELLTEEVNDVTFPWSLIYHEGKSEYGLKAELNYHSTDEEGISKYTTELNLTGESFYTPVNSIRFDVKVEGDIWPDKDSRTLLISSGGVPAYYELISPGNRSIVGPSPDFTWKVEYSGLAPAFPETPYLVICRNGKLESSLFSRCKKEEFDDTTTRSMTINLGSGDWWWGIRVYGGIYGDTLQFETPSNQFTVTDGPWTKLGVSNYFVYRNEITNYKDEVLTWVVYQDGEIVLERMVNEKEGFNLVKDAGIPPGTYTIVLMERRYKSGKWTYYPVSEGVEVKILDEEESEQTVETEVVIETEEPSDPDNSFDFCATNMILTPEELLNCGWNAYDQEIKIETPEGIGDDYRKYPDAINAFIFTNNTVISPCGNEPRPSCDSVYEKIGTNRYELRRINVSGKLISIDTITFTESGLILELASLPNPLIPDGAQLVLEYKKTSHLSERDEQIKGFLDLPTKDMMICSWSAEILGRWSLFGGGKLDAEFLSDGQGLFMASIMTYKCDPKTNQLVITIGGSSEGYNVGFENGTLYLVYAGEIPSGMGEPIVFERLP